MSENIRVSEVSDILRKQLEGINTNVQLDEIGTVLQVQDVFAVDLQTVTAAGHALVSAVKAQLHNGPPSFFVRVFRVVLLLRSS